MAAQIQESASWAGVVQIQVESALAFVTFVILGNKPVVFHDSLAVKHRHAQLEYRPGSEPLA